MKQRRSAVLLCVLIVLALVAAACGSDSKSKSSSSSTNTKASSEPVTIRLGYFPNLTHAPALVGIQGGIFKKSFAKNVTLETSSFNAGGDVITALFAGSLDASFIGPGPSISGFQKSNGKALRIVSGSTSGGAYLVVKPDIKKPSDLKGKTISTPQLGNTQDVALRAWLKTKGLSSDTSGGGDVHIQPQDNALTLTTFQSGDIDGAWVPEPWATRMISEGGGKILVDEKGLWPNGRYVTANVIVSTSFLNDHPDVVKQLIEGEIASIDYIKTKPAQAETLAAQAIQTVTGKPIKPELVTAAFKNQIFTVDPIPSSLVKDAKDAYAVGLIPSADVKGIYDLKILNEILKSKGQATIRS
ncbi:MAG: ABC transporter substrate-binding protein [Acidimicrobiia bacterium]